MFFSTFSTSSPDGAVPWTMLFILNLININELHNQSALIIEADFPYFLARFSLVCVVNVFVLFAVGFVLFSAMG